MTSGSIIMIPSSVDVNSLDDLTWKRQQGSFTLKSRIQFGSREFTINGHKASEALVIHEYIGIRDELNEIGSEEFSLEPEEAIIRKGAKIWVTPKYLVVDRQEYKPFVKQIINKGLGLAENTVYYLLLDTQRMGKQYPDHWARCFSDREGRVDRGTVYGTKINKDTVFARELNDATAKSIGVSTNYFGNPANIRVSASGAITIYKDVEPNIFLKFIESQVLPYQIKLD
ncbi:MAG: hypothetical protein ACREBB_01455 [Nitrosotalea sp.]